MKRWIFTILLFLLLGAILNVAVAWACARWAPLERSLLFHPSHQQLASRLWRAHTAVTYEPVGFGGLQFRGFGLRVSLISALMNSEPEKNSEANELDYIEVLSAGLPFQSMSGYGLPGLLPPSRLRFLLPISGTLQLTQDGSITLDRLLPLRPLWPGFAVNTLFYALILWLLIPGPFVLRRLIRLKRGRCPKCGYDLRGAPGSGCPECGWNRASQGAAKDDAV